jgi:anti-sigma regulatory factor (Ser/Thr protein kinase)
VAVVELLLSPLPSHVRTARLVAVAAARRAGLSDDLVDELRLALGEATSRAVGLHARHAPGTPVRVSVGDGPTGLTIEVTDQGPAAGPAPGDLSQGLLGDDALGAGDPVLDTLVDPDVALAVVSGLVDDVSVEHGPGGTTVTMRWPLPISAVPGQAGPGGTAVSA